MPRKKRRQFTAQQKVAILREHLLDRKPISEVCERHDLQPSVFYGWQRKFFENGAAAFQGDHDRQTAQLQKQNEQLRARLVQKDHIIARVTEEFVRSKKVFGEL